MATIETITETETQMQPVEVEVERVVLTMNREEAGVVAALLRKIDYATMADLNLKELYGELTVWATRDPWKYRVTVNNLGHLRVTKT